MRRNDVASTAFKRHVLTRFLINQCQIITFLTVKSGGWSVGAMVLGKLPVLGRPTIWITVGQGPTALAVGAGLFRHFYSHLSFLSSFYLSLGGGPI